jgi:hypothetical protein
MNKNVILPLIVIFISASEGDGDKHLLMQKILILVSWLSEKRELSKLRVKGDGVWVWVGCVWRDDLVEAMGDGWRLK